MKRIYKTVVIRGKEHKILIGSYPTQCSAYYKALNKGDWYAVNILHLPYVPRHIQDIQSEIDMLAKHQDLCDELERIKNMSPELARAELRLRFKENI